MSPSPAAAGGVALAATLAIQIYTSLAGTAVAVLAPELARDLGIAPKWVGVFVSLVYFGAMVASLVCGGFIRRNGAIRVSQVCVALCAIGIAVVASAPATALLLLVPAALVIGLGYGPITPSSSHVLSRTTRPERMSLVFSIKQTGVPVGGALAGAALPAAALAFGWRGALAGVAVLGLVVIATSQPVRTLLDADRRPDAPITVAGLMAPLAIVFRHRALADLALVSFAYSLVQVSLTTFLVVFLHETLQWTLVASGLALSAATFGGVFGRIAWGAVADRSGRSRTVLVIIGLAAASCAIAISFAGEHWPAAAIVALAALYGATAIGWNGVQLAEVARRAPAGQAGAVTGAAGVVTFSGVVAGPPLFAAIAALTGSYRNGFLLLAVASISGAMLLLLRRP